MVIIYRFVVIYHIFAFIFTNTNSPYKICSSRWVVIDCEKIFLNQFLLFILRLKYSVLKINVRIVMFIWEVVRKCKFQNWSKNLQMELKGETIVSRLLYIYISLELEVARAELSDLRALDTLRGNKCASLRFHGGWYVALVTACLFVSSLHDRGTSMSVIVSRFRQLRSHKRSTYHIGLLDYLTNDFSFTSVFLFLFLFNDA